MFFVARVRKGEMVYEMIPLCFKFLVSPHHGLYVLGPGIPSERIGVGRMLGYRKIYDTDVQCKGFQSNAVFLSDEIGRAHV